MAIQVPEKTGKDKIIMEFKFTNCDDFLLIELSGTVSVNERLLTRRSLMLHLQESRARAIIDLSDFQEEGGPYVLGILNMIKKEVQIKGGEIKLCCLRPNLYRYLKENRLDQIFDIAQSAEQAKRSFKGKSNGD